MHGKHSVQLYFEICAYIVHVNFNKRSHHNFLLFVVVNFVEDRENEQSQQEKSNSEIVQERDQVSMSDCKVTIMNYRFVANF